MEDIARYLEAGYFVESSNEKIMRKSEEIVGDCREQVEVAKKIFYWTRDEVKYNVFSKMMVKDEHKATSTLARKNGNCMQKAVLLCSLLRAAKIPARLGFADIRNHLIPYDLKETMGTNLFVFHGFAEAYLDGKWIKMTPAFDIKTCKDNGIVPVEFDGEKDAMLSPVDANNRQHFEYVRFRGTYFDFPFDEMAKIAEEIYGPTIDRGKFE